MHFQPWPWTYLHDLQFCRLRTGQFRLPESPSTSRSLSSAVLMTAEPYTPTARRRRRSDQRGRGQGSVYGPLQDRPQSPGRSSAQHPRQDSQEQGGGSRQKGVGPKDRSGHRPAKRRSYRKCGLSGLTPVRNSPINQQRPRSTCGTRLLRQAAGWSR